jgi:isoleucyl-tRNA synthetase
MNDKNVAKAAARDYSQTLFLPRTEFPMRANLPEREPDILARWERLGLYRRLRAKAMGRPKFILHDGPPYANGNIHIGHALNKILKDVVTRSQQMLGFDSNYVPGWDCHGLPIEWKIEEENYRAKGKSKPDLSNPDAMIAFRQECRAYAEYWLNVQREEFKRLGVVGDWEHPYTTMDFFAEAQIARELMKFAANGLLYRGSKPVMWSVVEKTALAEAEVEYEDYVSDQVWVAFPVLSSNSDALRNQKNARIVIWTTTPWTLPGNRAIAYSKKLNYLLVKPGPELPQPSNLEDAAKTTGLTPEQYEANRKQINADRKAFVEKFGDVAFLVCSADRLYREFLDKIGFKPIIFDTVAIGGSLLEGTICAHPLRGKGYDFDVPLLDGEHVTEDTGTGFVHTAPGHGREDFDLWMKHQWELEGRGIVTTIPYTVDENGAFTEDAPGFEGKRVLTDTGEKGNANEAVIEALKQAGMLIARGRLRHQYPHSWRSKKPVIFRNTPQWFIAMDRPIRTGSAADSSSPLPLGEVGTRSVPGEGLELFDGSAPPHPTPSAPTSPHGGDVGAAASGATRHEEGKTLRQIALREIRRTRWVPAAGENRITGMIESRPDWVISRQRAWGVPIALFVREKADGSVDILNDVRVNRRISEAFEQEGADAWYKAGAAARFLQPDYDPAIWHKIDDILDVWFDSGSTHAFVLEDPVHFPGLAGIRRRHDGGPDTVMYLEGSDQHRGWFHSSLLESCGTRGRAPFDVVLTHGFVLDEQGRKMSKSLGNVTAPQDVMNANGADILRMWVCATDYADDLRIGPEILKTTVDTYRKLRNTIRWMLGNLAHFREEYRIAPAKMPELERLMLHRLCELDALVRRAYAEFDTKRIFAALNHFMTTDLSAFYFDVRKDALYCDPISSVTRKACLTVLDHLFRCTAIWLAPMLCFTAEEAWCERTKSEDASVHLEPFPDVPAAWRDEALAEKWRKVRLVRRVVTGALEIARAGKRIGSSLEAGPIVHVSNPDLYEAVVDVDLAEVCITSAATLVNGDGPADAFRLPEVAGVAVVVNLAEGRKCARSWKISHTVGADPQYPDVTPRDAQALREWEAMRRAAE